MHKIAVSMLLCVLISAAAFSQSIYKCPAATPGMPPVIQQMPCSPTGGGESLVVKPIPTGAGSGLSEDAKHYLEERDKYWSERGKPDAQQAQRQAPLAAENQKANAAEEQTATQRKTTKPLQDETRR